MMPTFGFLLFEALGQICIETEFDELCFEFGLELDEVVTVLNDAGKRKGRNCVQNRNIS